MICIQDKEGCLLWFYRMQNIILWGNFISTVFLQRFNGIPKWLFYGMHNQSSASEYSKCFLRNWVNGRTIFTCLLDICVHGTLLVWCGMMCSAHLEQLLDRMLGDVSVWYKY